MARLRRRGAGGGLYGSISRDINRAGQIANTALDTSPLSRVDATRSNETTNMLNQYGAYSDPNSAAYVGRRSGEMQDYVGRLKNQMLGYSNPELNALREQRTRAMQTGFQGGTAALMRGQNVARTGAGQRAAQIAALARGYGQDNANAENDLMVKGADEIRRATDAYGTAVGGLESAENTRVRNALADYSGALGDAQSSELDRAKINLGQEATDRALKAGTTLGVLGIGESRRNARRSAKLTREGFRSNERISRGGGGGNSGLADALNELVRQQRESLGL